MLHKPESVKALLNQTPCWVEKPVQAAQTGHKTWSSEADEDICMDPGMHEGTKPLKHTKKISWSLKCQGGSFNMNNDIDC